MSRPLPPSWMTTIQIGILYKNDAGGSVQRDGSLTLTETFIHMALVRWIVIVHHFLTFCFYFGLYDKKSWAITSCTILFVIS